MKWCYTLLLLCACVCSSSAIYYKGYTTSDGLPGNNVYHAYRDHRGYLWFATDNGIACFDGNRFKTYTILNGIGDKDVFNFHEDRQHRLWLYTYNGTPCFMRNDSVFNAANTPLLRNMPVLPYINAMYDDGDSSLYIGYLNGTVAKLHGTNYSTLLQSDTAAALLTTIFRVHDTVRVISGHRWTDLVHDRPVRKRQVPRCNSFFYNNRLLVTDANGLSMWQDGKLLWHQAAKYLSEPEIIHLYCDTADRVFCSSRKGLLVTDTRSGRSWWALKNLKTTCVEQDIYGNYWVSTLGNGIFRIHSELDGIRYICGLDAVKTTYTHNGQFIYTHNNYVCTITPDGAEKKLKPQRNTDGDFLYSDSSWIVYTVPTQNKSVFYNVRQRRSYYWPVQPKHIYGSSKQLVALTAYNIYKIELPGGIPVISDSIVCPERIDVSCFDTAGGVLYYQSGRTLCRYDVANGRVSQLDTISGPEMVMDMYRIGEHLVLPANNGHLLIYRYASAKNKIVLPATETILLHVAALNDRVWILSTNKGYFLFSPGAVSPVCTGLQEIEFPFGTAELTFLYPSGNQFVCNANGVLYTFSAALLNKILAAPVLSHVKLLADGAVQPGNEIVIKGRNNTHITVDVSNPVFGHAAVHQQYRLVQQDVAGPWTDEYNAGFVIPVDRPGSYRIDIRSITQNNRASAIFPVYLRLEQPFRESPFFYILVLLVTAVLIYVSVHWYHVRRRKKLLQEINHLQLENKAINSLLNPHFVFNAINNIQHLINGDDKEAANHYLATMSRMIRQNMENLQFSLISVASELRLTEHYVQLQNLRFEGLIQLQVQADIGDAEAVYIPPLLIHTFVENAIVHGYRRGQPDFTIHIDIGCTGNDYLVISVRDNGVGLNDQPAQKTAGDAHTSFGIDFTRKRLQRLSDFYNVRYSLHIQDLATQGGKGTEAVIMLYSRFRKMAADPVR